MAVTETYLCLVVGKDAGEVWAWMNSYAQHWTGREMVSQSSALLLVDLTEHISYLGVDGCQRGWQRQVQRMRPETVILLQGWSEVQGLGLELDLLRATGAAVVFAEPFQEKSGDV